MFDGEFLFLRILDVYHDDAGDMYVKYYDAFKNVTGNRQRDMDAEEFQTMLDSFSCVASDNAYSTMTWKLPHDDFMAVKSVYLLKKLMNSKKHYGELK